MRKRPNVEPERQSSLKKGPSTKREAQLAEPIFRHSQTYSLFMGLRLGLVVSETTLASGSTEGFQKTRARLGSLFFSQFWQGNMGNMRAVCGSLLGIIWVSFY